MPKTILIHSFGHGVGRSSIAANLSFILAAQGKRVGIIDTDTKTPVIHTLFGLKEDTVTHSFNDYLWETCNIEQAAYHVTANLKANLKGQLILVPANSRVGEDVRILGRPQDVHLLNAGCKRLINIFNLDVLLIDTQPGVNDEALISITIADILVIVLRLTQGDYQGTGVTVDIVRQLDVPRMVLIINEAPTTFDFDQIKTKMEQTYNCEVAAVLPYVDEMMALGNNEIFALRYPNHPATALLKQAAATLIA